MRLWTLVLLSVTLVHGKEVCDFNRIEDFKKRLLKGGPVLEEILAQKEHASVLVEAAKQRPNPRVEMEYERGDQFGLEQNTYRLKALHTIELGDKRERRIRKSLAQKDLIESQLELSKAEFIIEGLITYRGAQQLEVLIEAIKEAIFTYKNIISKLSQRSRLTPEERVSLSTLRLALGDYEGKLHELVHEMETLAVQTSFWANCEKPKFKYSVVNYPSLPEYKLDPKKGQAKVARQKVELAQREFESQNSLGYSDVGVGPILAYQQQGEDSFASAGIGVTFSAPFFHTNTGGKLVAAKKLREAKVKAQNEIELLRLKLKKELRVYEHSLESLKKMPPPNKASNKHKEVKDLFNRGVIPISMVIEAHRQRVEYLRSWFEIENDILRSFREIYLATENDELIEKLFN